MAQSAVQQPVQQFYAPKKTTYILLTAALSYSLFNSPTRPKRLHSFDSSTQLQLVQQFYAPLQCLSLVILSVMSAGLKLLFILAPTKHILKSFVFIVRRSGSQMPVFALLII